MSGPSTAERRFIIEMAGAFVDGSDTSELARRLSSAAQDIASWDLVESLLRRHSCSGIAYSLLSRPDVRDACGVPDETIKRLRTIYSGSFAQVILEAPAVTAIVDWLERADVRSLVIKGFAVGTWLYSDPALREHGDIDLLVRESDEPAAHRALVDHGYRKLPLVFGVPLPMPGEALVSSTYKHDSPGRPMIDLSFDPMRAFWRWGGTDQDPFEQWWMRCQTVEIGRRQFRTLGAEDQFMQLARHLQHHDYYRVNWFVDLMLLLRLHGNVLDWRLIGKEAHQQNIHGGLYRTLEILDQTFGCRAPDEAWRFLMPNPAVRTLHRQIWPDALAHVRDHAELISRPLSPKLLSPQGPHSIAGLALFLADQNRIRNLKFMARRALPQRRWLQESFGGGQDRKDSHLQLLGRYWHWLLKHRREVRERIEAARH